MSDSFKCQYCNREFARLVNKNMHEKYCQKKDNTENKKNDSKPKNSNKCDHNYTLLNERIDTHRQAISQGYNAYCTKCQELS